MTATIVGTAHYDRTTKRIWINGVACCSGCGKPSATRFCNPVCEVKHAAEAHHQRNRKPARPLNQINVRTKDGAS